MWLKFVTACRFQNAVLPEMLHMCRGRGKPRCLAGTFFRRRPGPRCAVRRWRIVHGYGPATEPPRAFDAWRPAAVLAARPNSKSSQDDGAITLWAFPTASTKM